jgi:hypothetical protein
MHLVFGKDHGCGIMPYRFNPFSGLSAPFLNLSLIIPLGYLSRLVVGEFRLLEIR